MTVHSLIVLRHGESEYNDQNKFCGWIDIKLSDKGKEEAKNAGQLIKTEKFNIKKVYTSKLSRSIQTGHIILDELNKLYLDHSKLWELNERHYGEFQGEDREDIYNRFGKEQYNYIRRNFNGKPPPIKNDQSIDERYENIDVPNGESLKEVMDRFIPTFERILQELTSDVLIITHGSVVRSIIKYLNNVDDQDISKIEIPTGIPIIFEIENLKLINHHYYLDQELAKKNIEKYEKKTYSN